MHVDDAVPYHGVEGDRPERLIPNRLMRGRRRLLGNKNKKCLRSQACENRNEVRGSIDHNL